jgi:hypothetical protein
LLLLMAAAEPIEVKTTAAAAHARRTMPDPSALNRISCGL